MEATEKRPLVALHIIMPKQISGPNVTNWRLAASRLRNDYRFAFVTQRRHAKGVINVLLIRDLVRQFRAMRPDVVHLSGLQGSGFHAVVAARLAGCRRVVVAVHGTSRDAIGLGTFRKLALVAAEWLTLRFSDKFFTVSEAAQRRQFLSSHSKRNLGVVMNAAPSIDFDIETTRRSKRRQLGVGSEKLLVAIVGRMVYDKGLSYISRAIRDERAENALFVFIGDGPYRAVLERELAAEAREGNVLFLGQRADVLELLSACDLLLFASLHENLPNVLLEAMAVGLPIIATDVGGVAEIVQHERNGILVPAASAGAIVSGLQRLLRDSGLRAKYSRGSLAMAHGEFSMTRHEERMDDVYSRLLEAPRRPFWSTGDNA